MRDRERERERENLREGRDAGRANKFPNHQMLVYDHDALLSPPPLLQGCFCHQAVLLM